MGDSSHSRSCNLIPQFTDWETILITAHARLVSSRRKPWNIHAILGLNLLTGRLNFLNLPFHVLVRCFLLLQLLGYQGLKFWNW